MNFTEVWMNKVVAHVDSEVCRIALMSILGLIGGAVRICDNPKHKPWRYKLSSLLSAAAGGALVAAALHETVTDHIYLGLISALGGYSAQLTLSAFEHNYKTLLRKWRLLGHVEENDGR